MLLFQKQNFIVYFAFSLFGQQIGPSEKWVEVPGFYSHFTLTLVYCLKWITFISPDIDFVKGGSQLSVFWYQSLPSNFIFRISVLIGWLQVKQRKQRLSYIVCFFLASAKSPNFKIFTNDVLVFVSNLSPRIPYCLLYYGHDIACHWCILGYSSCYDNNRSSHNKLKR